MKKYLLFFVYVISFFILTINVNATTMKAKIDYNDVNLRSGPGTGYTLIRKLPINSSYALVDNNKYANERGCSDGWYKIYYSGENVGYVCASYVSLITFEPSNDVATSACEIELSNLGFPKSYWGSLCDLKSKHSNWTFVPDVNGIDFNTAVSKQAVGKKSLIQTTYQGYLSTSEDSYNYLTDEFVVKEGSNWYSASEDVVAYYLDPRNFLDERYIFMFEKLSFDANYQTVDAVNAVLFGRDLQTFAQTIYNASSSNNVNAIYLASRIRQETGANYSSYSLAGHSITYNGITYDHVYNPYNIGANTGAYDGLVWAVAGDSYQRPWTSIDVAISGGADLISSTYISKGQDTGYFQKFNTSSYSAYSTYSHQYMANVKAAYSEASIAYDGYNEMNLLNSTNFKFVIPVYSNMKETVYELPSTGNPNNHLRSLTVNGNSIVGFSHDIYEYNYYVSTGVSEIRLEAQAINSNAIVNGVGNVKLLEQNNKVEISVVAQNNKTQIYTINIIKTDGLEMGVKDIIINTGLAVSDNYFLLSAGYTMESITAIVQKTAATAKVIVPNKMSGNLVSGDIVTITNGSDSMSFNVVIKGDPNGDGNINIQDLLKVQKYILGYSDLSGSYLKAGDTNQDGIVDIVDLLRIQKHILGYLTIN